MMVKVRTVDQADAEDRRQRIIVILLFAIGFLGLTYLVYDYVRIMSYAAMPEDLDQVDPFISQLKATGLVRSLDVPRAELVVDEGAWNGKTKTQKTALISQVARYCADKNGSRQWSLNVVALSGTYLGGIGSSGIKVN